jgi:hypothetical protein
MCPIIGLKSAVIVVGGSETGEKGEEERGGAEGDDGSADSDDGVAVVSGRVVNRIPIDTAESLSG